MRELAEETGLGADDITLERGWAVIFERQMIACLKPMRLKLDRATALARYRRLYRARARAGARAHARCGIARRHHHRAHAAVHPGLPRTRTRVIVRRVRRDSHAAPCWRARGRLLRCHGRQSKRLERGRSRFGTAHKPTCSRCRCRNRSSLPPDSGRFHRRSRRLAPAHRHAKRPALQPVSAMRSRPDLLIDSRQAQRPQREAPRTVRPCGLRSFVFARLLEPPRPGSPADPLGQAASSMMHPIYRRAMRRCITRRIHLMRSYLSRSCAILRWSCRVGSVLFAQSFSSGLSPPLP